MSDAQSRQDWERIDAARELLNGKTPRAEAISLDLPAVTQDGSSVPVTVEINYPMNRDDYVEALYLFAGGNPSPELLEVNFTPLAGKPEIATRVRLDSSQTVLALARTNSGEWLAGSRDVRVTVSGCLSRNDSTDSANFMRARVRTPDRLQPGQPGPVRTLINHPMETGLREDDAGNKIPRRIIEKFSADVEGETVLEARFHRAVAANPYLQFFIAPGHPGTMQLNWIEDTGESASETAAIPGA